MKTKIQALVMMAVAACMSCGLTAPAVGAPHLIEATSKEGEPYRDAVRVLLRAIIKGDEKAAEAAFVGVGDDLKLLRLTLATNTARQRYNDAVRKRFKDAGMEYKWDYATPQLRGIDATTIIAGSEGPDEASFSPDLFPFCGFVVNRRHGKWLVRSITVFPKDVPHMLAAHPKLAAALDALTVRINHGEFKSLADVEKAEEVSVGPIMAKYEAATDKGRPTTRRGE
ncbi:MAG TPA: hypothetical protein VFC46_01520 [Humisphaera sp.]|nr:hypothetical protein [Humisphaera sp.]